VPARQFAGVNVSSVRVPVTENATFVARSRPMTQFAVQRGVLTAGGPPVSQVERVAGKRIQPVSLAQSKTQAVPIRTSLQGKRASVVVPASERAKLITEHEKRGPQQASRTKPEVATSEHAVRQFAPTPAHEKHEKATVHQPPPTSNERNVKHEREVHSPPPKISNEKHEKATVHQPSPPPPPKVSNEKHEKVTVHQSPPTSNDKNVKHERVVHSPPPPPPPPPSNERHEKPVTQAQLNSGHQPPPAHVEKQPNVQPKPQGPPPAAKGNPPAKEKDKEHGKEN
jgi:hypothetical protein